MPVPSRQEVLLDAAIDVLGSQGVRALTHRAVDAAAGMPAGSASNYFKTRDALLSAVVHRFAERERAGWEGIAGLLQPSNAAELASALAAYVRRAAGPDRGLTVARYGLFVEAALRPDLARPLAESAAQVRGWGAEWLRAAGSTDPAGECALLLDHLDGVILHHLAFPGTGQELADRLGRAVRALTTARR